MCIYIAGLAAIVIVCYILMSECRNPATDLIITNAHPFHTRADIKNCAVCQLHGTTDVEFDELKKSISRL